MTAGRRLAGGVAVAAWLGGCAAVGSGAAPAPGGAAAAVAGPASPAPAGPDLSGPVRMADLIDVALARSPRIAAARAALEAAAERRPQETALPDPMLETTWFARNAMDEGRRSYARWDVMVRQAFPLPQVLALRGDVADAETRAAALRYEAAVRDVLSDVEVLHAERSYLAAAEDEQTRLRDVYRRYAEVARAAMKDGAARLAEAFRAEALAAQAEYDASVLRGLRRVQDEKLRALLGLANGAPVGPPADARPVLPLDAADDALLARARTWNQELREAGVEVERAATGVRQARWAYAPELSLGVGLMKNDEFDAARDRGEDSVAVALGVSLPIWGHKLAAGVREAEARERAARAAQRDRETTLAGDVAETAFRVRTTQRLAELYARTLVPQADAAASLADARVREGGESLSTALELAAARQQIVLARLRAVADHAQALARLERLVGAPLAAAGDAR